MHTRRSAIAERRPYRTEHQMPDAPIHRLIDALPAGVDDPWQAGWLARAEAAQDDLADCAAIHYERGFADASRKLPTFTTACVCLTLAAGVGFLAAVALFG